jgi:hypothetical protein
MMSLRLLVPLLETRLLCFVCSDAFIGASLFEEVTQKIAPSSLNWPRLSES